MNTSEKRSAVEQPARRGWRRHSDEFRARVVELARQPSTSVAAVALANGLNANMLRRWVRECELAEASSTQESQPVPLAAPAFMQLPMHTQTSLPAQAGAPVAPRVEVEIQRSGTTVRASLPLDSCSAAWLREVTS